MVYITLNFTRFARFLTPARITAIPIATLCSVVVPDPLETAAVAEASQLQSCSDHRTLVHAVRCLEMTAPPGGHEIGRAAQS